MNTLSGEILNAREADVSGDLMRLQQLASREIQNLLGDGSANAGGAPISAMSGRLAITPIAATFTMALAPASALFYDPTDGALTPDDSANKLVRWVAQNLAFANPDGANPRIDLVVALPGMVSTDLQTRNILTDPVTRTFAPQTVAKTINPQATLSVIAGTPASSPVPPAVPARSVALAEVYVPAAVSDSSSFGVVPRLFRRAPFPWSVQNAILSGCALTWDLTADPTTTSSALTVGQALQLSRVVIEGEVLETAFSIPVFQDAGANNPFAAAAPTSWNRPYYVYLVGGRNAPQAAPFPFGGPLVAVESLVPPLLSTGHPGSPITTPRGTTTQLGAVYIGLGSVVANTTRRAACVMDDSYTYHVGSNFLVALNNLQHVYGGAATAKLEVNGPAVVPAISTRAAVQLLAGTGTGTSDAYPDQGDGTAPSPGFSVTGFPPLLTATAGAVPGRGVLPFNAALPTFWAAAAGAGTLILAFAGFDHGVRRLR